MKKSEDKCQEDQDEEDQRKEGKMTAYLSSESENCKNENMQCLVKGSDRHTKNPIICGLKLDRIILN